jgi:hypothetical protein
MSEQLIAWIRRVAALNDVSRSGRKAQIGQQEFTQCICKIEEMV